jgi:dynein heavy chain
MIPSILDLVPVNIDIEDTEAKLLISTSNALTVVLKMEAVKYNKLLDVIRESLTSLERGIDGLEIISEDIEALMHSINNFKVPKAWKFLYFSVKPLMSWIDNLNNRVVMFNKWAEKG